MAMRPWRFKFNTGDINDLLKSLVLEDRGGGQISAVTYGSKDPITKTLKKFAIDLTANPTLSQILNQIRGERIEFAAPGPVTGTLLGVETRKREAGPNHTTIDVEIMNVLTDEGLRSVPLDQVGAIKIVNTQLDKEFRQALAVLALGHDADKKSVTLHFAGNGKRPVRVGLHSKHADLENQLSALLGGRRSQTDAAGLGDRRKHDRGRLAKRQTDARQRPARLVHHESLRSSLCPASHGRAGTLCRPASAGLRTKPGRRRTRTRVSRQAAR